MSNYVYHPEAEGRPIVRRHAPPLRREFGYDNAKDDTAVAMLIDAMVCLGIFLCFGSITAFVMKIQMLKEAPSWSVALYLIPISVSAIAIAMKPHMALRTALVGGPFFLFVLWALFSTRWSNQPDLTMRQGLLLVATYAVACMLAQSFNWARIGRILTGLFTMQAVCSAGLAVLKPEWGVMSEVYPGSWSGIWSFKQTLGVAMAVGAGCTSAYLLMKPKSWVWTAPALGLMIICVIKSQATTAILVTGFAIMVPFSVWLAQRNRAASVFAAWAVVTAATSLALMVTVLAPFIFQVLGKAPTLTGRTDIWAALESAIAARPLVGWGFQAFWTDLSMTSPVNEIERAMDGFRPPDAHSTPIDIRLQLGIIGLALAAAAFFRMWIQIILQAGREPGMMIVVGIIVSITSMCFTEAIGLYPMDGMTLIIHLMLVKTALTMWDHKDKVENRPQLV